MIFVKTLFCINNFLFWYVYAIYNYAYRCVHKYICTYICFFTIQMFKLSEKYDIIRNNLKCDYIRYSPSETSTINTANSQIYNNIPREESALAC